MPRVLRRDVQQGFSDGLNTTADESQLGPKEVRVAENARLTEYGGATKRLGTQQAFTSPPVAAQVQGGFVWRKPSPASTLYLANGHLLSAPVALYPWTATDLGVGFDPNARPSFASFRDLSNDVVYIADGGMVSKWDGGTLTADIAGTPNVSRIAVFNQRLFGIGDPDDPEAVYFSGLSNGDTLGNASADGGKALVQTFAHERLTGLLAVGQSLLMTHERGISRFTGWSQDDFEIDSGLRGVTQDIGTISPDSLVAVENVGFFVSDRGIYSVNESGVTGISSKIESLLAQVASTDLALVSAAHNRRFREVWFAIPNLGVLVYNYRLNAWSGPLTGIYSSESPIVMWDSGAGSNSQVFFGGSDGTIRQADVDNLFLDDVLADGTGGDTYTMTLQCHRMFFGDDATEKSLRFIYLLGNLRGSQGASLTWDTGTLTRSVAVKSSGTAAIWGLITWNAFTWGAGGSTTSRIQASGSGRYNDIRIIDSGSSNPVFSRLEADAFDMGRRY